jgi:hypothetical protein
VSSFGRRGGLVVIPLYGGVPPNGGGVVVFVFVFSLFFVSIFAVAVIAAKVGIH